MMGIFVQTNEDSIRAKCQPVGYVIQEDGCWEWTGCKDRLGYGKLRREDGSTMAHRWMYERECGPIATGLQCHHTCANPTCVNPDHVEIVTPGEHYKRDGAWQEAVRQTVARQRAKTHCRHGHPYTGDNLYVDRKRNNRRDCRKCDAIRHQEQRDRAKRLAATEAAEIEESDDL